MLTAHIPAGYCLTHLPRMQLPFVVPVALFFSILPDLDLFWFYWVDGRSLHHHRYWVHIPAFWICMAAVVLPLLWRTQYLGLALVAFAALFLHLILDTLVGGILWLYPWDNTLYRLVTVAPTGWHWLLTFVLHWTFLLELVVWGVAIGLYRKTAMRTR